MNSISRNSTAMLILSGLCILSAIFLPIWSIYLDAPQYPEGLGLSIYANKLGGDVDTINGLNHYIGMKTLHAEEFIEFTVLPYIIGFFGILAIITGLFLKTKKSVIILLVSFLIFGILAMYDFWRWEYNYGHNLDPNAAIIVPGMAYQPPLIGFKQLLNFGAYSIPAIGGWLMLVGGVLIGLVYVCEAGIIKLFSRSKGKVASMVFFCVFLTNCSPEEPEPIILNKDICSFCKMNISDGHFGAEIITEKGRIFKFDDISCMMAYKSQHQDSKIKNHYVHHYTGDNELIPAENAYYIQGGTLKSPMAGNVAAFKSEMEASQQAANLNPQSTHWNHLTQAFRQMKFFTFIIVFLSFSHIASGAHIHVGPRLQVTSIRAALLLAKNNDTITVHHSLYTEGTIDVNKSITIIGDEWPVLDGQLKYEVVSIKADHVNFNGFVIRNSGIAALNDPGGVKVYDRSNIVIENNVFENNFFAIYIQYGKNCLIKNNKIIGF